MGKLRLTAADYTVYPASVYKVFLKCHGKLSTVEGKRYVTLDQYSVCIDADTEYCDIGFYSKYGIYEQE